MAVSFSTTFSNPCIVASKSNPLPPQPLFLSSAPFSSIPRLFSTNGMTHRRLYAKDKSNGSSVNTLVEEQPQSLSGEKEVDDSTEATSELKQKGDNLRKFVGTTGIVLAVIVGSTAALLSVNAILSELSDKKLTRSMVPISVHESGTIPGNAGEVLRGMWIPKKRATLAAI